MILFATMPVSFTCLAAWSLHNDKPDDAIYALIVAVGFLSAGAVVQWWKNDG